MSGSLTCETGCTPTPTRLRLRFVAEEVRTFFGLPGDVMGVEPGSAVEMRVETLPDEELHAIADLARVQAARFHAEAAQARESAPDAGVGSSGRVFVAGGVAPTVRITESCD
jgi:hypothetical protein